MGLFAPWARRLTAWTSLGALLAALALPMLPAMHTIARAEADCAPLGRSFAGTRLDGEAAPPATTDHCVMCHWQRAARSATVYPVVSGDPALTSAAITLAAPNDPAVRLLVIERPSRAPPALS